MIWAVLLVGLVAAYLIVNSKFASDTDSTDTSADTTYITVNQVDESSIVGISYTNKGVEYSFTLSGDKWTYLADATFPVDSSAMADYTSALAGIRADRALEADLKSAEYGLDSPAHTIKVTLSAGGSLIYNIGAYNKHSDSYYMTAEGHDKVYMVKAAFGELFSVELYDLLLVESLPEISTDEVTSITAVSAAGTVKLEKSGTGEDVTWTHTNREGGAASLESESADKIVTALTQTKLTECVDHNATDEQLRAFGLGESEREKITVTYNVTVSTSTQDGSTSLGGSTVVTKELVYYIGRVEAPVAEDTTADTTVDTTASKTEQKTYLMLDGSRMVYEVTLTNAAVFFE